MDNQLNEQFQSQERTSSNILSAYRLYNIQKKSKPIGRIIFSIISIVGGIVSIILGLSIEIPSYTYTPLNQYGGDAYTGIQNAAASTANRVGGVNKTLCLGFKYVLITAGILAMCYFALELLKSRESYTNQINTQI